MISKKCECGKEIEGYNENQVKYLMEQHQLSKKHKKYMDKK